MQDFLVKYNNNEKSITCLLDNLTLGQLKSEIQKQFGLISFKLIGLKRKTGTKQNDDDIIKDCYILKKKIHPLGVIGTCNEVIIQEEKKILYYEEQYDEEINYDIILQKQQNEINREITRLNTNVYIYKGMVNTKASFNQIALLSYYGNIDMLKRKWEPDYIDQRYQLITYAIKGNQQLIIDYLLAKRPLSDNFLLDCFKVSVFFGQYDIAFKFYKTNFENSLNEAIQSAIENGHLRILKWLWDKQKIKQIDYSCYHALQKGYEKIVKYVLQNEETIALKRNMIISAITESPSENMLQILLDEREWTQELLQEAFSIVLANNKCATFGNLLTIYGNKKTNLKANIDFDSLHTSVKHNKIESVQYIIYSLQSTNSTWWLSTFSYDSLYILFIDSLKHNQNLQVAQYFLQLNFVSDFSGFLTCTDKTIYTNLVSVLHERLNVEIIVASVLDQFAKNAINLPNDINRLILLYYSGTEGRNVLKYKQQYELFLRDNND